MLSGKQEQGRRLYNEHLAAEALGQHKTAYEKLSKSARLGEVMAKHALAYLLEGRVSDGRRLRLYREAVAGGFGPSAWNLARYYEIEGNEAEYFKWLRRAAQLGDEDAQDEMRDPAPYLYKSGLGQLRWGNCSEGMALIRMAARWGNLSAKQMLGRVRVTSSARK